MKTIKKLFQDFPLAAIMILVLIVLLLTIVPSAMADRVDDLNNKPDGERCGIQSTLIYAGMLMAPKGTAVEAEIEWAEAKAIEDNPNFRPFNDRERAFLRRHYELGLAMSHEFKESNGRFPTKEEAYGRASTLNQQCVFQFEHGIPDPSAVRIGIDRLVKTAPQRDRSDEIKALPTTKYCEYIAGLFAAGVMARNEQVPLLFKHVDKWTANKEPARLDAIYIIELNGYTTRERMFVFEHISAGWRYADTKHISGVSMPENKFLVGALEYQAECVLKLEDRRI